MRTIACRLFAVVLALAPYVARGEDPVVAPEPLAGIEQIYVRVESLPEVMTSRGIGPMTLILQLRNALQEADILPLATPEGETPSPLLELNVSAIEISPELIVYAIALEVKEDVVPQRNSALVMSATTWFSETLGVAGEIDLPSEIPEAVRALADELVTDLLDAESR